MRQVISGPQAIFELYMDPSRGPPVVKVIDKLSQRYRFVYGEYGRDSLEVILSDALKAWTDQTGHWSPLILESHER